MDEVRGSSRKDFSGGGGCRFSYHASQILDADFNTELIQICLALLILLFAYVVAYAVAYAVFYAVAYAVVYAVAYAVTYKITYTAGYIKLHIIFNEFLRRWETTFLGNERQQHNNTTQQKTSS